MFLEGIKELEDKTGLQPTYDISYKKKNITRCSPHLSQRFVCLPLPWDRKILSVSPDQKQEEEHTEVIGSL